MIQNPDGSPKPDDSAWFVAANVPLGPALAFGSSFLVYLWTLAPTVYRFDSAELSAAAYNLGVPHATGYPLYLLLGKLFTYPPVGDIGYRLNLMSAFFAAGAVTTVYLVAFLVSKRAVLSLAIAGSLAFSYYFWASAVVAEVYTLHAFMTGTTIYLLLLWNRNQDSRLLYGAAFVWGLSFGNHMSTVLLGPAFAYVIALAIWRKQLKGRQLLWLALCFVPTLGVYGYLPLRYMAEAVPYVLGHYNEEGVLVRVDHTSIGGMWQTLTARQFHVLFFPYRPLEYLGQVGNASYWLLANFLGIGLVLGILGIVVNYANDRGRVIVLGLVFVANVAFFAGYGALDKEVMFLPAYVCWAVWMAEGGRHFLETVENRRLFESSRKMAAVVGRVITGAPWEKLSLLLPVAALTVNLPFADVSSDTSVRDRTDTLMSAFESNALVLARWPDEAPMAYLQIVEKKRPDILVIDRFRISPQDERRLIERSLRQRPVYVFGPLPVLPFRHASLPVEGGQEMGHRLVLPPD